MVITHAGNICGTLLVCTVLLPWGNKSSRGNSSYKKKIKVLPNFTTQWLKKYKKVSLMYYATN